MTYRCECLDCGEQVDSDEHCREIRCPKCGGEMRRVERPGPGNRSSSSGTQSKRAKAEGTMASRKERKRKQSERRKELELKRLIGKAPTEFEILSGEPIEVFDLSVEAAAADGEKKLKRFKMVAYTGGAMNLLYWPHPIIIDLAGVKIKGKSQPIFRDHMRSLIVGHTTDVQIEPKRIRAEGVISGTSGAAREVADTSANDFPWQASVGCSVAPPYGKIVFVDKGEKVEVNGRSFTGPCYVARSSMLKEISFVALGADDNTSAKVAASAVSFLEDRTMKTFEEWVKALGLDPDALDDEQSKQLRAAYDKLAAEGAEPEAEASAPPAVPPAQPAATVADPVNAQAVIDQVTAAAEKRVAEVYKRLSEINAFSAEQFPGLKPEKLAEIKAKALAEKWTVDATELALLREARPQAPSIAGSGRFEAGGERQTMLCAALAEVGGMSDAGRVEAYGADACTEADKLRGIGLQEFLVMAAAAGGVDPNSIPKFRQDAKGFLHAAFSTVSVPYILSATANKLLLDGFNAVEQVWRLISKIRPVNDFKQHTRHRMIADGKYEKLGPMGEIKHGVLDEQRYTQQIDTFAKMFGITRQDIINDDLGVFDTLRSVLGIGAADAINDVFWTLLLANSDSGTAFFSAAHSNQVTGAANALGITGLDAVEQLILGQKKPAVGAETKPSPLGLQPKVLLVSHQLGGTARTLYKSSEFRNTTASKKYATANIFAGKYGVEERTLAISGFPGNSSFSGYSATAFYLFVDPEVLAAIEVAFLNGKDAPTIESADADFNTLGIQLRGYHDFGVAWQEYRAAARSTGTGS